MMTGSWHLVWSCYIITETDSTVDREQILRYHNVENLVHVRYRSVPER
jgi:hypothetical protein